jgi:hypothetical protein
MPFVMHRQANGAYGNSNGGAANESIAAAGGAYGPPQPAYGAAASAGGGYGAPQPQVLRKRLSMTASVHMGACGVYDLLMCSDRLYTAWLPRTVMLSAYANRSCFFGRLLRFWKPDEAM